VTGDELRIAAQELARRSRLEQGLPEKITDPAALQRTALMVRGLLTQRRASGSGSDPDRTGSSELSAA
jgi:hypothetical protein